MFSVFDDFRSTGKLLSRILLRCKGGQVSEIDDVTKEVHDLCRKHDGFGVPTFTPVYEKHIEAYWHSYADH